MFDNLLMRITSPSSRRRHTYHCPEVHSDPEDNEPITPRKPRLLERRKRTKKGLLETGLRQARSLGRLDGIKEVHLRFSSSGRLLPELASSSLDVSPIPIEYRLGMSVSDLRTIKSFG
ncbi:hypothetical protein WA026_001301 [Henosepilachna vigintioctopunctata]|uniref:Uncharacterized protein n=1 Tax=Henosepilachna vigintioctopunctata TaxID=420089 RepID=A0AAW1UQS0_9CUCU